MRGDTGRHPVRIRIDAAVAQAVQDLRAALCAERDRKRDVARLERGPCADTTMNRAAERLIAASDKATEARADIDQLLLGDDV